MVRERHSQKQRLESRRALRLGASYVKVEQGPDFITYILDDTATVTVYNVSTDDPVAALRHESGVLSEGQVHYETLFSISAEHSYGDCAPRPWWTK